MKNNRIVKADMEYQSKMSQCRFFSGAAASSSAQNSPSQPPTLPYYLLSNSRHYDDESGDDEIDEAPSRIHIPGNDMKEETKINEDSAADMGDRLN